MRIGPCLPIVVVIVGSLADGQQALEEQMWVGGYDRNFLEHRSGKKSDDVMGYGVEGGLLDRILDAARER